MYGDKIKEGHVSQNDAVCLYQIQVQLHSPPFVLQFIRRYGTCPLSIIFHNINGPNHFNCYFVFFSLQIQLLCLYSPFTYIFVETIRSITRRLLLKMTFLILKATSRFHTYQRKNNIFVSKNSKF